MELEFRTTTQLTWLLKKKIYTICIYCEDKVSKKLLKGKRVGCFYTLVIKIRNCLGMLVIV
jgi:hypothetical protein